MHSEICSPFSSFAPYGGEASALRRQVTAAYRKPEHLCISELIGQAEISGETADAIRRTAMSLVSSLRAKGQRGGVEALIKEYSLSSQEGVALMCLAESLLRVPDNATRDALIRDKIAPGDWQAHLGQGRSLFVNAATWGLVVTGKLVGANSEEGLGNALSRLIARAGEPVIRCGVDMALELMGEQFVTGETIDEALRRAKKLEVQGYGYSYDMLGEAAVTAADADRYLNSYEQAIHAIGKASTGRGIYGGPGISIKLSALHPRFSRAQLGRVMAELLPKVRGLAVLAKGYGIGFNIDAEEADRLELSLDLLECLAYDSGLAGWNGLGFVVQAYGKRCPYVIDWLIDLAKNSGRRMMVRLVKGAYWDSEIKRAQVDGLIDFPVYTRKIHTDVSYIACARKLLASREAIFPQFATHNAQTVATIYHLAGPDFMLGDYEFQCLHGMGEPLYEEVVGPGKLDRPCRIYAPVGAHETLLAYLARRLLENGANSSFVHRIWDENISVAELACDPVDLARDIQPLGAPHAAIALPADIYGARTNSAGLDLGDERLLAELTQKLRKSAQKTYFAAPMVPRLQCLRTSMPVINPSCRFDQVGRVEPALDREVGDAVQIAIGAFASWAATPVEERAVALDRAADEMQVALPELVGLIIREAGKSTANAIAEVREAIDFLRYYARQARQARVDELTPLGLVVCISPWNFPLAIFIGQIAAALVVGNIVLAKPAEETPLIAAEGARILHAAGIPVDALLYLPGDGALGAALVARPETAAVIFTGSTEVAKLIQNELAKRCSTKGAPIPLIAETGGQNAMIVDSSALAEQVTADVIASAFDSAGQRCSALRVLCLQEDIADRQLAMLKGALAELTIGRTDRLATDIGPVISLQAKAEIVAHIKRMRSEGYNVEQLPLPAECEDGTFIAPTIIEIDRIDCIGREVFGPVLHVLRYSRSDMHALINQINQTGYGLTFGLHTRLDETIADVTSRIAAGNLYVNRNMISAVVGVQPFGGRGLSGTGPKAGGPLYLGRLVHRAPKQEFVMPTHPHSSLDVLQAWLKRQGVDVNPLNGTPMAGCMAELPGPVGERNLYALHPCGSVLLIPHSRAGLISQIAAALATGNAPTILASPELAQMSSDLPSEVQGELIWIDDLPACNAFAAVLIERRQECETVPILRRIAAMQGPIPLVQLADEEGLYRADWLVKEVSISINTTASGGNPSLMALV
ncbi:bifunctional proline dehydrogenase/L-glutamate gamma-semialdehyde dehydrogenase PutA [Aquisediminimonas sediminicola]|uniref:bifunctional proline dehydrogenase/L-glutamate gamma-semialdehyde dehydrogenase PutA n=1 Tax=Alteraquisediminimonas sediminicola TaxID=2676787 RepID=UPI0031B8AB21